MNLKGFQDYLISKHKDEKTITAYISDITQFISFIDKPINNIKNIDIEMFKAHLLREKHYSPKSINRKLVAISVYMKFLHISIDIVQIKIHNQNFLDEMYSDEDVKALLEVVEIHSDYRTKALINTLRYTGMRISEALQLKVWDIHNDTITINGKGNKLRSIFIPSNLRNIWLGYLPHRINKGDALFTGKRGAITRETAYRNIKKYGELANIDKEKVNCHNFRHKYVKDLIKQDIPIDAVADLVGHSDINITRTYSRRTKQELLDIINNL